METTTTEKRVKLYSTDAPFKTYEEFAEYYKECYLDEGEEIPAEGSDAYYDTIRKVNEDEYDAFRETVDVFDNNYDEYFVIEGSIGTWRGRLDICQCVVDSLWGALQKCWNECDDVEVWYNEETERIEVNAFHHDGTNHFSIGLCTYEDYTDYNDGDKETVEVLPITKAMLWW